MLCIIIFYCLIKGRKDNIMEKNIMRPLTEAEMKSINGGSIWDFFKNAFNWIKSHFVKSSWEDGSWEAGCTGRNPNVTGGGIAIGI